jgi:hypothetical protein
MSNLILVLLFVTFLLTPAPRQQNLPTPLDPVLVFPKSDLIEVVETLPLYIADEKQVSFYDYNTKAWLTYPYPNFPLLPGEIAITNFTENTDGTYTLKVDYYVPCDDCEIDENYIDLTPPHAPFVRERWHFNPKTGAFTPFEAICGDHARAKAGEGEWVITSLDGGVYLCNTDTGQTSASLPNIDSVTIPAMLRYSSLSPNGRWLVFTFYYDLSVWAYDFVEGKLNLLGSMTTTSPFTRLGYPNFSWIDDQRIAIENLTLNYGHDDFYLYGANVYQPDSLKLFYHSEQQPALNFNQLSCSSWLDRQFDGASSNTTTSLLESCVSHEGNVANNSFSLPNTRVSPDKRFLFIERPDGTLDILNVATRDTTTIAQIPDGGFYDKVWETDGSITITVWINNYMQGQLGRWRVRVKPG